MNKPTSTRAKPRLEASPTIFLTSHALVTAILAERAQITTRELAKLVGITERQVQVVVEQLRAHGYVTKEKKGRFNYYIVNDQLPLLPGTVSTLTVASLVRLLRNEPRRRHNRA